MAFNGTPRPSPRWHHARTELDDFAIVGYRVPTGALARLLPAGFAPVEFTFEDGERPPRLSLSPAKSVP